MVRSTTASSYRTKRRFRDNGFDLDLSYITPQVIVVGIPPENKLGFRNPTSEILKFMRTYHDGRFKIMNLNEDRNNDSSKLGKYEERIPVEDHQPAPLSVILTFCQTAVQSKKGEGSIVADPTKDEWLSKDENNVLLTYYKPGKGKAALMICSFLLYTKYCPDPSTALQFYAEKRTISEKAVMLPSQRRYVGYFHDYLENDATPSSDLELAQISFTADVVQTKDIHVIGFSNHGQGNRKLKKVFSTLDSKATSSKSGRTLIFGLNPFWITGDVKVAFFADMQAPLFYFWFNSAYVQTSDFSLWSKEQLDGAPKSMESDCQVSLFFTGRKPTTKIDVAQLNAS